MRRLTKMRACFTMASGGANSELEASAADFLREMTVNQYEKGEDPRPSAQQKQELIGDVEAATKRLVELLRGLF